MMRSRRVEEERRQEQEEEYSESESESYVEDPIINEQMNRIQALNYLLARNN